MFSSHTKLVDFKTQQSPASGIGFVFEEISDREITRLTWCYRFRKSPFSICFPSIRSRKASVLRLIWFEKHIRKPLFWNFSGVDWTLLYSLFVNSLTLGSTDGGERFKVLKRRFTLRGWNFLSCSFMLWENFVSILFDFATIYESVKNSSTLILRH